MKVAHLVDVYEERKSTFIYNLVRSQKDSWVVTTGIEELSNNPHIKIFSLSNLNLFQKYIETFTYFILGKCFSFEKFINSESFDLIHAHFGNTAIRAISLKKNCNIPLITSFYGSDVGFYPKNRPGCYLRLMASSDLNLVLSNDMKRDLIKLGFPDEKILVHHIGINTKEYGKNARIFSDCNPNVNILTIARFVEKKGLKYALFAMAELVKKYPHLNYRIMGYGPQKEELIQLIKELDLENYVKFISNVESEQSHEILIQELNNTDIYLQPSITASDGNKEGTPVSLIEALASYVPCVATDHGGIPEIVINGKNGWVVPEKDVASIVIKISDLIDNIERRKAFGLGGKDYITENFDLSKQNMKLNDIYNQIISISI